MADATGAAAAAADKTGAGAGAGADAGAAAGGAAAGAAPAAGAADTGASKTSTILSGGGGDAGAGGAGKAADAGAGAGEAGAGKTGDGAGADWRARMAGGDAEALKRLGRFTDEAAVFKAYRQLEARLSSGEYKRGLPEGASAEEVAAWRKEQGLPDKPDGYVEKLALPKGMVIGDADKPIVAEFAAVAHEAHADPKTFSALVSKYYEIQDKQAAARDQADVAFQQASIEELREAWQGPEYQRNKAAVENMLAGWPEGLAQQILAARTPPTKDNPFGTLLGNQPGFIRQLAALALELNPAATLVPNSGGDPAKSIEGRLNEIRTLRREQPDKYEADKALQKEELELLDAQIKMQKRAG